MTIGELKLAIRELAQQAGATVAQAGLDAQLLWADFETGGFGEGYIRLCADAGDALLVIEAALHCDSVLPRGMPALDQLLALHFMSGPQGGERRAYPVVDVRNRHLLLTFAISPAALRDTAHVQALAQECAAGAATMSAHARMLAGPVRAPQRRGITAAGRRSGPP